MKIWFDLSNSPHVNLFAPMIRDLQGEHEVLITSRPLANTVELLKLEGLAYHVVGSHYGASKIKKVYGFVERTAQLRSFVRQRRPDVAISQSTFNSPLVARLIGVRSIYMNDNEHALGNVPAFLMANTVMVPEFLDLRRVTRQGARRKKIIQYPGVKEAIYLWAMKGFKAGESGDAQQAKAIYVRPEPWTAQYYDGAVNFLDPVLVDLKKDHRVMLLPRDARQAEHYRQEKFAALTVAREMSLATIANDCKLFIGAGGTMTREMAVLGIPTISVYQAELLDVDRYLISAGRMLHEPSLDSAAVRDYLCRFGSRPPDPQLLEKGRQAYDLIKRVLLNGAA